MKVFKRFYAKELQAKMVSNKRRNFVYLKFVSMNCSFFVAYQISTVYGLIWPWSKPFRESLPSLYQAVNSELEVFLRSYYQKLTQS